MASSGFGAEISGCELPLRSMSVRPPVPVTFTNSARLQLVDEFREAAAPIRLLAECRIELQHRGLQQVPAVAARLAAPST